MKDNLSKVCRLMHYHAVDDSVYYSSVAIVRNLLKSRLRAGVNVFEFTLSNEEFDTLYLFLEQMETMYEHPRSTSKRYRAFWKEQAENQAKIISDQIEREHQVRKNKK